MKRLLSAVLGMAFMAPVFSFADDDLTERKIIRSGIARNGEVRPGSDLAKVTNFKIATSIDYKVLLLEENGQERSVPMDYEFKIGQQFRLEIEANNDLYLYVFHEGPNGDRTILMPDKFDNGQVPLAKQGDKKVIPDDGTYFEFVPPAGNEKLLVFATPERRPELTPKRAFEEGAGEGTKEQLELKSAQDKILSEAKKAMKSPATTIKKQVADAGKPDNTDIVFRGFVLTDTDATTAMVGSTDPNKKPPVYQEIVLKSSK